MQDADKFNIKKSYETPNNKKIKDEEINDFTISSSMSDSVDLLKKNENSPPVIEENFSAKKQ